jgi:hypothetical protein
MPKTLAPQTVVLTPTRSCERFDIIIPTDGAAAYVTAYFVWEDKDGAGVVRATRPGGRVQISQARLLELLPGFGLPSFPALYAGLRDLLHAEKDAAEEAEAQAAAVIAAAKAAAEAAAEAKAVQPPEEPPAP